MPKTATDQLIKARMTIPTMMDMVPPLTAERIWPPSMQLITLYPTMMIMFSTVVSLDGQYPMKYRATTYGFLSVLPFDQTITCGCSWAHTMALLHRPQVIKDPSANSKTRWAWVPQCIVLLVLVGSAGPHFDSSLQAMGDSATITANRLSFFSLQLSVPLSWAGAASDFFVYFPETMSKWKIFMLTLTGLTLSFVFVNLLGVGLGSGVASTPAWSDAYDMSPGALILAGYGGLETFGKFCAVIVVLGLGSNQIPSTYAVALDTQVLGRGWKAVPQYIWATVVAVIYFVCAIAGRDQLFLIFQNFLALMGYWLVIFVTIVLEEHIMFRRRVGFDWTAWEDKKKLPVGIAALSAFLIGWVGPIVGMHQVWWTGPLARKLSDSGGDLGIWLGSAISAVIFPPLRYLELKTTGR